MSSYKKVEFEPKTKKCERCGKEFTCYSAVQYHAKKYCGEECRLTVKREKDLEGYRRRAAHQRPNDTKRIADKAFKDDISAKPPISPEKVMEPFRRTKEKEKVKDYLLEDATAARAAGMSYGQYTSQRYAPRLFRNS